MGLTTQVEHATSGAPLSWLVPKTAHADDECILGPVGEGLFATAVLLMEPLRCAKTAARGIYYANIGKMKFLREAPQHWTLAEAFPKWQWPTYPKSYATVSVDILGELWSTQTSFQSANESKKASYSRSSRRCSLTP
jgi:hypothetical protein